MNSILTNTHLVSHLLFFNHASRILSLTRFASRFFAHVPVILHGFESISSDKPTLKSAVEHVNAFTYASINQNPSVSRHA